MEISFAAEKIGYIGTFPVTNSFVTTVLTSFHRDSLFSYARTHGISVAAATRKAVELLTENIPEKTLTP